MTATPMGVPTVNATVGPDSNLSCLDQGRLSPESIVGNPPLRDCVCFSENITVGEFGLWQCSELEPSDQQFNTGVIASYVFIVTSSVIGNGLLLYVIVSSPRMRTVTNYLMANMAVGDLLMTLLCVPFTSTSVLILRHWPFGDVMCRLVSFTQAVAVFVSAFSLVAISGDRYRAIIYPLRPRCTTQHARLTMALIWLLAAVVCLPIAITSRTWIPPYRRYLLNQLWVCDEHWQNGRREVYSFTVMLMQYFIPVLVLVFTYARIAAQVWGRRVPRLFEQDDPREARLSRARRKVSSTPHQPAV